MMKDVVLQLRYLGVIPRPGHREYGFSIEDKNKGTRQVVLSIDDGLFRARNLMFQEAPDLCYQKVLMDLRNESPGVPIRSRMSVSESDVEQYRDAHPIRKSRNRPGARR